MTVYSSTTKYAMADLKIINFNSVWVLHILVNTLLAAHFQFKLPVFVQVYFPVVRAPKSTMQVHVSRDWVTSPAFKRILFCEAREIDRGANLFWHCHAGGSPIHSGKANKRRKADRFAYSAHIVKNLHSGVHSDKSS